jgi:hypothetical protein
MLVDGTGGVRELVLPVREEQADRLAADWIGRTPVRAEEGTQGVADR